MTDFLLELLSEEIPARMQGKAKEDLARLFTDALTKAGLKAESVETFATPRRLALIAKGLPLETEAVSEETKGPKVGAPPQALEGFLRKTGLSVDQLEERDGTYFAVVNKPGRKTADVLAESLPTIIRAFPWPKSQRWGKASLSTESLRWVRPLQGIVAILGNDLVPFAVDGIVSSYETQGHRFHHSGPITIGNADDYVMKLRAGHVIVHFSERCAIIRDGAKKLAADKGLTWIEDEALVSENAGLTEWPVPLIGDFDPAFLEVPREVIQLTLATNQKYFVCADAEGELAPAFICTSNIDATDGGAAIVAGNRKVLAARLSDARFFWEQDQKKTLEQHAEGLKRITFHEKLGTVADKVERVAKLARWLVEEGIVTDRAPAQAGAQSSTAQHNTRPLPSQGHKTEELANLAEQAARLAKADLVTEMVGEFPELQGVMGGYYAEKEGLDPQVAAAIRDHYKPVGQGDEVPTAPVTVAVSLADKLDSLIRFFAIDEHPTGSKDPFALRRAGIATINLTIRNDLRVPISLIVRKVSTIALNPDEKSLLVYGVQSEDKTSFHIAETSGTLEDNKKYGIHPSSDEKISYDWILAFDQDPNPKADTFEFEKLLAISNAYSRNPDIISNKLVSFLADRLKVQQKEAGVRHDLIDAVFALGGEDDLVRLLARVKALQAFIGTDDGANLLAGYKRAANLLAKSDSAPAQAGAQSSTAQHNTGSLPAQGYGALGDAERNLLAALDAAEPRAAAAVEAEVFEAAMAALATLRAPIDAFFEGVMVNDPDPEVRAFRLGLLARVRDAVHRVADFSRIEG